MMIVIQIATARAILNIFETSSVLGEYGAVTVIPGDTGHLTFGRSQTTLGPGNLVDLIGRYMNNVGARFAQRLRPRLGPLRERDASLDDELHLQNVLRATADDRVMRDVPDEFFDQVNWQLAVRSARRLGITAPLGTAAVYDGTLHGSWDRMRRHTDERAGTVAALGNRTWIEAYVQVRRDWLANHPRRDLRPTVYRMDGFQRLISLGKWGLELPLVVRGHESSELTLNATPRGSNDGPEPGTRALELQPGHGPDATGPFSPHQKIPRRRRLRFRRAALQCTLQTDKGIPVKAAALAELVVRFRS